MSHVLITGASGYLAGRLARHLHRLGYRVTSVSRSAADPALRLDLGGPIPAHIFYGVDTLIHAAHNFSKGAMSQNVEGTAAIVETAQTAGIRRLIFLSSYSALPNSASEYGQTKYYIEQSFGAAGGVILRPGLVIGNGGLFATQRRTLLRTPIIPVVGNGTMPTSVIAIRHFVDAVANVVAGSSYSEYGLFYDNHSTVCDFVRAVRRQAGKGTLIMSIPPDLAIAAVRVAARIGLKLPVHADQIRTLLANSHVPFRSSLATLLPGRENEFHLSWALTQLEFDQ